MKKICDYLLDKTECLWAGMVTLRRNRSLRRSNRRRLALASESMRRIQLKEYGGVAYVSFDGVPLVDSRILSGGGDMTELLDTLTRMRDTYALYMLDCVEGGLR